MAFETHVRVFVVGLPWRFTALCFVDFGCSMYLFVVEYPW